MINTSSLAAEIGIQKCAPYVASKGAVRQLTKSLARDWAPHNIQVNAIGPGYFHTDLTEPLTRDPERAPEILSRIPMKRWGEPDDLKGAVVFLASAASNYVTGQTIYVDGGWLAA